ncbi:MAG: hypothetical protein M3Q81_02910 [bacterium]|nr:hypothetical protein [bacterium]
MARGVASLIRDVQDSRSGVNSRAVQFYADLIQSFIGLVMISYGWNHILGESPEFLYGTILLMAIHMYERDKHYWMVIESVAILSIPLAYIKWGVDGSLALIAVITLYNAMDFILAGLSFLVSLKHRATLANADEE